MAWHIPGQWNPGVPQMTPDMNMGSYSAEQWAAVQQQNWHQWSQWQQQYSQWQSQYGEKYAEQMQSMQGMGAMPPLPLGSAAPPPAPPPPEQPPPPHENNQPLFAQPNPVPAPVPQPQKPYTATSNNVSISTGNTQNWAQPTDAPGESPQAGVNTEALKKLAEEERLFDIQFEKWEEEIEKWKRENVDHPDRQAYNEYEQKFETCRAQLLERRQVMKQKRARLLGQVPAAGNVPDVTGNTSAAAPPIQQTPNSNQNLHMQSQTQKSALEQPSNQFKQDHSQNNFMPNKVLHQNFQNKPPQNYHDNSQYAQYNKNMPPPSGYNRNNNNMNGPQSGYNRGNNNSNDPQSGYNRSNNNNNDPQSGYNRSNNNSNDLQSGYNRGNNNMNDPQTGYNRGNNNSNDPQTGYNRGNNNSNDPQSGYNRGNHNNSNDPQSGYNRGNNNNSNNPLSGYNRGNNNSNDPQSGFNRGTNNSNDPQSGFNRSSNNSSNPRDEMETYYDTNLHDEDYSASNTSDTNFLPGMGSAKGIPGLDLVPEDKPPQQEDVIDITDERSTAGQLPPDYTTISKGINSILGDEKIMNILSMVRDQGVPSPTANNQGPYGQKPPYNNVADNFPAAPNNQWDRNQTRSNEHYENAPSNMQFNQRGPGYPPDQSRDHNAQYYPQKRMNNDNENELSSDPYTNAPFSGPNMQSRGPLIRPNMPPPRPLMQGVRGFQNDGQYPRGPPGGPPGGHPSGPQRSPLLGPPGGQAGPQRTLLRGPSDIRPMRPNMPPPRPLMQVIPGQDDNNYSRPPLQGRPGQEDENEYASGPPGRPINNNVVNPVMNQPPPPVPQPRAKWSEDPQIAPSIIVDYQHKPLRLKAREFIEPVHIFEYNHTSKDGDSKKKDFEREADELFSRKPRRFEPEDSYRDNRFAPDDAPRQYIPRDYERRHPRDDYREEQRDIRAPPREEYDERRRFEERPPPREEYYNRRRYDDRGPPPREEHDDRRRLDERYDDRRRDDRERYSRREEFGREMTRRDDRERDREDLGQRDRQREFRREDSRNRSKSRDRDSRKRGRSRESTVSESSLTKKTKEPEKKTETPKHVVMIDDLLEPPGREMRPEKIVIILRGPPGSGKSYLAKLIRDREAEHGGTARIMSIDDYFMQEGEIEEKDPVTGKMVKKPSLKYEYEAKLEETYLNSLKRAFKRSLTDGYFTFLIFDAVNDTLRSYADIWNFARQNGFQVYICTMELDSQICFKRNIHGRTLGDVQVVCTRFFDTPDHHIQLDATTLLQSAAIADVHMEDADDAVVAEDARGEVESSFTSKWEKLDDAAQLARLDGTSKPLRPSQPSMEDYLQLDDWKPTTAKPGKKTVRWADIEESRKQEKMRAIGFVVGQTDWNRMTDPTMGSSALTQTKYIERVKRN